MAAAAEWRKKRPCWEGHLSRAIGIWANGPVLMIHLVRTGLFPKRHSGTYSMEVRIERLRLFPTNDTLPSSTMLSPRHTRDADFRGSSVNADDFAPSLSDAKQGVSFVHPSSRRQSTMNRHYAIPPVENIVELTDRHAPSRSMPLHLLHYAHTLASGSFHGTPSTSKILLSSLPSTFVPSVIFSYLCVRITSR